jgi:hypothetical protein
MQKLRMTLTWYLPTLTTLSSAGWGWSDIGISLIGL